MRLSAVGELGVHALESQGVAQLLETALLTDPSAEVRRAAAIALADGAARGSVSALLQAAEDRDPRVRQMALMALGELGDGAQGDLAATLHRALCGPLPALRFQALASLVGLDIDADESLARGLQDGDGHVRLLALRLLSDRAGSAAAAGEATNSAAPPWLRLVREQLRDPLPTVRLAAALVLQGLGDGEAEEVICQTLNDTRGKLEVEEELRAIDRVGRCGLIAAVPGLRRRAAGSFWLPNLLQWPARTALALLGDAQAKSQILRGLQAWSWQTRTTAAHAAGVARLAAAQPQLQDLAARPDAADPQVVQEALQQLDQGPMKRSDTL
ncbi:MAG TPA: HEAT repeat domain-containing protein [Polyangiaceae bacterium]|nr:HEAT repeat domain-containing protein [Polyangiaceae bacterium]